MNPNNTYLIQFKETSDGVWQPTGSSETFETAETRKKSFVRQHPKYEWRIVEKENQSKSSKVSKLLQRILEDQEQSLHDRLDKLETEYDQLRDKKLSDSQEARKKEIGKQIDHIHDELQLLQKNRKKV